MFTDTLLLVNRIRPFLLAAAAGIGAALLTGTVVGEGGSFPAKPGGNGAGAAGSGLVVFLGGYPVLVSPLCILLEEVSAHHRHDAASCSGCSAYRCRTCFLMFGAC